MGLENQPPTSRPNPHTTPVESGSQSTNLVNDRTTPAAGSDANAGTTTATAFLENTGVSRPGVGTNADAAALNLQMHAGAGTEPVPMNSTSRINTETGQLQIRPSTPEGGLSAEAQAARTARLNQTTPQAVERPTGTTTTAPVPGERPTGTPARELPAHALASQQAAADLRTATDNRAPRPTTTPGGTTPEVATATPRPTTTPGGTTPEVATGTPRPTTTAGRELPPHALAAQQAAADLQATTGGDTRTPGRVTAPGVTTTGGPTPEVTTAGTTPPVVRRELPAHALASQQAAADLQASLDGGTRTPGRTTPTVGTTPEVITAGTTTPPAVRRELPAHALASQQAAADLQANLGTRTPGRTPPAATTPEVTTGTIPPAGTTGRRELPAHALASQQATADLQASLDTGRGRGRVTPPGTTPPAGGDTTTTPPGRRVNTPGGTPTPETGLSEAALARRNARLTTPPATDATTTPPAGRNRHQIQPTGGDAVPPKPPKVTTPTGGSTPETGLNPTAQARRQAALQQQQAASEQAALNPPGRSRPGTGGPAVPETGDTGGGNKRRHQNPGTDTGTPRPPRLETPQPPGGNPPGRPRGGGDPPAVGPDGRPLGRPRAGDPPAVPALGPDGRPLGRPTRGGDPPVVGTPDNPLRGRARVDAPGTDGQRQARWLQDQLQNNSNFARNFERLTPQQREAIMRLEGRQQDIATRLLSKDNLNSGRLDRILGSGDRLRGPGDFNEGQGGRGRNQTPEGRAAQADLIKSLAQRDLKVPGMDFRDPQTRDFLRESAKRFDQLKLTPENANQKLSDVLKGLDPKLVSALEKFLARDPSYEPGKLTLGQLDQSRLNLLLGKGGDGIFRIQPLQGDGRNPGFRIPGGDLVRNPGSPGGSLGDMGRWLLDFGSSGPRLGDTISRNFDNTQRSIDAGTNYTRQQTEFSARLTPAQDMMVQALLNNSMRLGVILDTGRAVDGSIMRVDMTGQGRGDISAARPDLVGKVGGPNPVATTFGDRRGDFIAKGDAVGSAIAGIAGKGIFSGGMDGIAGSAHRIVEDGVSGTIADAGPPRTNAAEFVSRMPIDPVTGLPYDPATGKLLDPATGRAIGDKTFEAGKKQQDGDSWDDKEDMDEKEKKKRKEDIDDKADRAKQKAMLLLLQAKKKREQELRDKALKEKQRKEEDEKRVKYICKEGDTVNSIANKQLRDARVAALIYQINKEVIPTKIVKGEKTPVLYAGLIIWLPSPKEIREFRTKLMGSSQPGQPGAGEKQYASAEDELAAKFGNNWSGDAADGQGQQAPAPDSVEHKLMLEAMAEAKKRRENIEKALGPIGGSQTAKSKDPSGRPTYVVRLGNTLRSVATNHPLLRDVNLWRLLAEVNGLSTDVDSRGQPKAGIIRGTSIKLPTQQEIQEFRQRTGLITSRQPLKQEDLVSKICKKCGRMNVASATLCPACGHEFEVTEQAEEAPAAQKDAATLVMEAAGMVSQGARTEDLDSEAPAFNEAPGQPTTDLESDETEELSREQQEHTTRVTPVAVPDPWVVSKEFETYCRLAKSHHSWSGDKDKLVIQLQLKEPDSDWYPILEYEIFATHSLRHSYSRQAQSRKSVKIDLPAPAAQELAQNDLIANWNSYKQKYLSN